MKIIIFFVAGTNIYIKEDHGDQIYFLFNKDCKLTEFITYLSNTFKKCRLVLIHF